MIEFTAAPDFNQIARIGILEVDQVSVKDTPDELKALLTGLAEEYARIYKDAALGEISGVQKIRTIFHRSGLDPTRYRPSSESLLRRAVKGKGLYFINSVVDVINYYSMKLLCPMGLFDAGRVHPPIEWRLGREGEYYQGIGRDQLHLVNFPLLADREGPFGSLVSDSMKTRITEQSTRIVWFTFAPPGTDLPLDAMAAELIRWNGGIPVESRQFDS